MEVPAKAKKSPGRTVSRKSHTSTESSMIKTSSRPKSAAAGGTPGKSRPKTATKKKKSSGKASTGEQAMAAPSALEDREDFPCTPEKSSTLQVATTSRPSDEDLALDNLEDALRR